MFSYKIGLETIPTVQFFLFLFFFAFKLRGIGIKNGLEMHFQSRPSRTSTLQLFNFTFNLEYSFVKC